jgi:hypothetical protein
MAPRQNLTLTLDGNASILEIYTAWNRMPSRQDFDHRVLPNGPDAELTVPSIYDGGILYVMVYANSISVAQPYTLSAQSFAVRLTEIPRTNMVNSQLPPSPFAA